MEDTTKETLQFWNNRDVVKEFETHPLSSYWVEFFGSIKNPSTVKILDLGCGGGRNTGMLVKYGFDVYSCDVNEGMVNSTRKKMLGYGLNEPEVFERVSLQSMTHLNFADNFFDIVLSHGVYHNALDLDKFRVALRESSRVLKHDGLLCFNMFTSDHKGDDLTKLEGKPNLYLTKEKLPMVLVSKEEFINEARFCNLFPDSDPIEYTSNISTGKRSVIRGILKKANTLVF